LYEWWLVDVGVGAAGKESALDLGVPLTAGVLQRGHAAMAAPVD
jgi:hypothetical protein